MINVRKVEIFIGHEIDEEKIKKMKSIAYKVFKNLRFKRTFKPWHDINSLEPPYLFNINNKVLVLVKIGFYYIILKIMP